MPTYLAYETRVVNNIEERIPVEVEVGGDVASETTRAAPQLVTAAGGITPSGAPRELLFVKGSGGDVTVTADPRIAPGTSVGQELMLKGVDDGAKVTLANGNGMELNGACVLKAGSFLRLMWDGTVWGEVARNDL